MGKSNELSIKSERAHYRFDQVRKVTWRHFEAVTGLKINMQTFVGKYKVHVTVVPAGKNTSKTSVLLCLVLVLGLVYDGFSSSGVTATIRKKNYHLLPGKKPGQGGQESTKNPLKGSNELEAAGRRVSMSNSQECFASSWPQSSKRGTLKLNRISPGQRKAFWCKDLWSDNTTNELFDHNQDLSPQEHHTYCQGRWW